MEPLGIIVFSCIMGTAGFSVILEAVLQLIDHAKTELPYEGAVIGAFFGRLRAPGHMPWIVAPALLHAACGEGAAGLSVILETVCHACRRHHDRWMLPSVGNVVSEPTSHTAYWRPLADILTVTVTARVGRGEAPSCTANPADYTRSDTALNSAALSNQLCMNCAGGTVGVIAMKIGMYIMCRKSSNSSVQAFALDHINDVVVNSVGLVGEAHLTCLLHFPAWQPDVSCAPLCQPSHQSAPYCQ